MTVYGSLVRVEMEWILGRHFENICTGGGKERRENKREREPSVLCNTDWQVLRKGRHLFFSLFAHFVVAGEAAEVPEK